MALLDEDFDPFDDDAPRECRCCNAELTRSGSCWYCDLGHGGGCSLCGSGRADDDDDVYLPHCSRYCERCGLEEKPEGDDLCGTCRAEVDDATAPLRAAVAELDTEEDLPF